MVFDAHALAFACFGGVCASGIYDNMTTAVDAVFLDKERKFNRRFLQIMVPNENVHVILSAVAVRY